MHEVQEYLHAYTGVRGILGQLNIPAERISARSHLEHDLGLGETKKSELISLLGQHYNVSVGKDQIQYVSDIIEYILVDG